MFIGHISFYLFVGCICYGTLNLNIIILSLTHQHFIFLFFCNFTDFCTLDLVQFNFVMEKFLDFLQNLKTCSQTDSTIIHCVINLTMISSQNSPNQLPTDITALQLLAANIYVGGGEQWTEPILSQGQALVLQIESVCWKFELAVTNFCTTLYEGLEWPPKIRFFIQIFECSDSWDHFWL